MLDQVWPLGSGTAIGMGNSRLTGKNQSGAPIEAAGLWTATYIVEGGKWKIRMLTAFPQPPPPRSKPTWTRFDAALLSFDLS